MSRIDLSGGRWRRRRVGGRCQAHELVRHRPPPRALRGSNWRRHLPQHWYYSPGAPDKAAGAGGAVGMSPSTSRGGRWRRRRVGGRCQAQELVRGTDRHGASGLKLASSPPQHWDYSPGAPDKAVGAGGAVGMSRIDLSRWAVARRRVGGRCRARAGERHRPPPRALRGLKLASSPPSALGLLSWSARQGGGGRRCSRNEPHRPLEVGGGGGRHGGDGGRTASREP